MILIQTEKKMNMRNRNERDAERRNYIKARTLENIELVKNDPQSLYVKYGKDT